MSLISDALKKAQRQRTGPDTMPPIPGVGRAGREDPSSPQSLAWIISGGVGLVVIAVAVTVFFLRPKAAVPPQPVPSLAVAKSAPAAAAVNAASSATSPIIAAPIPAPAKAPEPAPAPALRNPIVAVAVTPAVKETPTPVADAGPQAGQPVTTKRTKDADPDPRIIAFVDAIRVTGIRSSGSDSKVLMNDKVFRVNDLVDRGLNLRLTDVQTDSLTFVDANGVVYTKNI